MQYIMFPMIVPNIDTSLQIDNLSFDEIVLLMLFKLSVRFEFRGLRPVIIHPTIYLSYFFIFINYISFFV